MSPSVRLRHLITLCSLGNPSFLFWKDAETLMRGALKEAAFPALSPSGAKQRSPVNVEMQVAIHTSPSPHRFSRMGTEQPS